MFSPPLNSYEQNIFSLRHMSISYTTATLAKLSLAQANTISHHSPDSPLNVNAFPAPPNAKFPPRQSFSTPSVDMLRIPPWPAQTSVPAAPRWPEDTMTVIQRVEQRTAEDAIFPSIDASSDTAHVRKREERHRNA